MKIAAGKFKAQCLKLMDDVHHHHEEIIITKYSKPIAKLTFIEESAPRPLFGWLKDEIKITGNIVKPIEEKWNADE